MTTTRQPNLDTVFTINADGSRNTIYPADVKGRFQIRKKIVWTILFAIYLALPWIVINGQPAVLIDIGARHFYLFGATFNAQDFYLAFFVLSGIGFGLIVLSAVYGRVWCGYACPHTVFLEGFYRRIERWIEGNRGARQKLTEAPWTGSKILKRGSKWLAFLVLSAFLAHTLLSYFMGVDEVFLAMTQAPAEHPTAFTFVLIFTAILMFNFGWFREQLCIVICPYGRLQGVLNDPDTVNVAYDNVRGEPRGRMTQQATEEPVGDCIDCHRCVMVCPTGIDIRNGLQLECVGCANCIDACDEVMTKIDRPTGLIRYESERGIESGKRKFWRPRLALYAVLMIAGLSVFTYMALGRKPFEANVLRMPTPYVILDDAVRNQVTLHVINKQPEKLTYRLTPVSDGPEMVAHSAFLIAQRELTMEPLQDAQIPIFVTVPRSEWRGSLRAKIDVAVAERPDLKRVVEFNLLGPR